jgi:glycosidase
MSSLKISTHSATPLPNAQEADYTISHVYIDERANQVVPITSFFDPQGQDVPEAQVFTNLNRRERAVLDADGDGIEDGIKPPDGNKIATGDDSNYYKAYPMNPVPGGYVLTLNASKCGAYRLTVRYRLGSDAAGSAFHWYGDEKNGQGIPKRDHAVVISPSKAVDIQLYETDVLSMDATGLEADQRSTFTDLIQGPPAGAAPQFSLKYLKSLGINTVWLLPIHPTSIDGRQDDPNTRQPYNVGSPYSVKNFFAVMPLMSKAFKPGSTPASNDTPAGRKLALADFVSFVGEANKAGIDVMLDVPFNHTGHDVELADAGQAIWGNARSTAASEIRNVEAKIFSLSREYDRRASNAGDIAPAPDRVDFGKWNDTYDLYFGRYAALVAEDIPSDRNDYTNEGDWFDYSIGSETVGGSGNGHFDHITQCVWRFFGEYLDFWLTQTGYPQNPEQATLSSTAGIAALRGDFAQGLPPQCWEYLINRARSRKWNLVFMAESLDGGAVAYRSARHFDILNESLIYDLHQAESTSDFRNVYEARRSSYGGALLLLNTTSHDEDTYKNSFQSFLRFAVNNTMRGVPLISAGQELGMRGTLVPPNGSDAAEGPPFGFEKYFAPFAAEKQIPEFMTFNSMMPLWNDLKADRENAAQLQALYRSVGSARRASKALRSDNYHYLNLQDGTPHGQIFSVAKFEERHGDPAHFDVVFCFINLQPGLTVVTPPGNHFNLNVSANGHGMNDFGIKADRLYNVKNIAAYTLNDPSRSNVFLWETPQRGQDLLTNGLTVIMNPAPSNDGSWSSAPYEAQYLKIYDVTPAH